MSPNRAHPAAAGALFLLSHVTSIPALALYGPALHSAAFLAGEGADGPVLLGAFLEVLLAAAVVGTAVALFPVVRRGGEGLAIGYVALRTLEAAVILAGVVPMLALVALRGTGADAGIGSALAALHDATFLLGPGFVCALDTAVLATLLLRSRQVPRFIPVLGLIGAPLLLLASAAQLFGVVPQYSTLAGLPALPVFAWEVSLAVFLLARGLRPAAVRPAPEAVLTA
jgi:hypothetical protein